MLEEWSRPRKSEVENDRKTTTARRKNDERDVVAGLAIKKIKAARCAAYAQIRQHRAGGLAVVERGE
jgi:hypothetical protein